MNKKEREQLTAHNREIVKDFVELFYGKKSVREAFEKYVANDYIQHNPQIPDGREPAIQALEPKFGKEARFDIKRILVDGELAAIHLHGRPDPASPGGAVVDLFRIRDGKIVEHWDVLQAMPSKAKNDHPMF